MISFGKHLVILMSLICLFSALAPGEAAAAPETPSGALRVAILRDSIAGLDPGLVDHFAAALTQGGCQVKTLDAGQLASAAEFNTRQFDWLLLVHSPAFPLTAKDNLIAFMREGGDVALLGGHAFIQPLVKADGAWHPAGLVEHEGQWLPPKQVLERIADGGKTERILIDFETPEPITHRSRNTSERDHPTTLSLVSDRGGRALRVDIKKFNGWDMQTFKLPGRIPKDHNLITFWAKGDAATPQLSIEVHEADGRRWFKAVNLDPEWRRYAVAVHDFAYLDGGAGPGDKENGLALARVRRVSFGLAAGITRQATGDHTFWVDELGSGRVTFPDLDLSAPPQLSLIMDYEPVAMKSIARLAPAPGQKLLAEADLESGSGDAFEVIGFNVPGRSNFMPLLRALDAQGRLIGAAAGLTIHYGGPYAGSQWLAFGLSDPAWYRQPAFAPALLHCMKASADPALAAEARAADEAQAAEDKQYPPFNLGIGTQTFGPTYQFTSKTRLVETAEAIRDMGSSMIKLDLSRVVFEGQYHLPPNPAIKSLRDLVEKEPSYREVLAMPFHEWIFWMYPLGWDGKWRDGMSEKEKKMEYKEVYDLACTLLKTWSGSRRTFFLGHWEGDWSLLGGIDLSKDPTDTAVQGMIDWLNVRQQAIDDAKRDTPHQDVEVYHYTEVNAVRKAIKGGKTVTNSVLPHTHVDFVSYSSYDSLSLDEGFEALDRRIKESLDYLESKLPPKKLAWPGKRVFIGEYGFPLRQQKTPEAQDAASRAYCAATLEWGCPFILYWEMFDNEAAEGGERASGFWMINHRGRKQPVYLSHYRFYQWAREYASAWRREHHANPDPEAFRRDGAKWLRNYSQTVYK